MKCRVLKDFYSDINGKAGQILELPPGFYEHLKKLVGDAIEPIESEPAAEPAADEVEEMIVEAQDEEELAGSPPESGEAEAPPRAKGAPRRKRS